MSHPTVTVAPGLEIPPARLLEFVAMHNLPGEQVRLDAKIRFQGESEVEKEKRAARFGDRVLTVKGTILSPADGGCVVIEYEFDGMAGRFNAGAFSDNVGDEHAYGVLTARDGQIWFTPFNGEAGGNELWGPAVRVSDNLPRSARYCFGVSDPILLAYGQFQDTDSPDEIAAKLAAERTVEAFSQELETEPLAGEFTLSTKDEATGAVTLLYAPWMCSATPGEIDRAKAAIYECCTIGLTPGRC